MEEQRFEPGPVLIYGIGLCSVLGEQTELLLMHCEWGLQNLLNELRKKPFI
jgi:hypothetical protein